MVTISLGDASRSGAVALRMFLAFLRRPGLQIAPATESISRVALSVWLLIFSFAVTALAALLALPLILLSDAAPGEVLRTALDRPAIAIVVTVVVLGPLIEEMIFRGWLTGTVPALVGTATFLALLYGGSWLMRHIASGAPALGAYAILATVALAASAAIQRHGHDTRPAWYRRAFPLVFWAQGIVFAGLHYSNLATASAGLAVLAAVPFVVCGWLWGYARIVLGLGTAWLLHATYNVPAALATMAIVALRSD